MMKSCVPIARILIASVLMACAACAGAQAFPSKPIRLIVPFPPGGTTDPLARLVGQKLSESLGQPVLVENHPGGNTVIGAELVVKSKPDGHTIMLIGHTNLVVPQAFGRLPFDALKDLAPVATTANTELILLANPAVPANNLQELIAFAKARPMQLNHGSTGSGTINHLSIELLNIMAGIKIQNIAYKGSGPALTDLIGGHIELSLSTPISAFAYLKSGKLKAIAISGETRLSALPQVPTFAEAGLPNFNPSYWYGVFAAAATPKVIVNKLSTEIAKTLGMPDVKEKLLSQGLSPFVSTPEQMDALMKSDLAKFANVIKTANIKLEN